MMYSRIAYNVPLVSTRTTIRMQQTLRGFIGEFHVVRTVLVSASVCCVQTIDFLTTATALLHPLESMLVAIARSCSVVLRMWRMCER